MALKSEKIESLKQHLEKTKNLLSTIPKARENNKENYLRWVQLEVIRTERKIKELQGL